MNPIDRIIKEKLEGLEAPFDAGSWQLMEQRLNEEAMGIGGEGQPAADTKHIDEAVFEKLHRYQAAYQPGHWKRMEALLEEAFAWPRKVLRYKLTELALMLLLFLFLWQYIPGGPAAGPGLPQALENTPQYTPADGKEEALPAEPRQSGSTTPDAPHGQNPDGRDNLSPESASAGSAPATAAIAGGGSAVGSVRNASPGLPSSQRAIIAGNERREASSRYLLPLASPELQGLQLKAPAYPLPARPSFNASLIAELNRLDALSPELSYETDKSIGDVSLIKNKTGAALRVGMFGSAEYNHITVPSSEEKKLEEELQRYAIGYGGGLSVGLEMGRFEIETGVIYAARQYPVGLVYVNGSVGSGLQGQRLEASELNIINLPLHFRYSFLRRGGWRAYALAGASLQVAFQRNYYVSEEPKFNFRPMQPPAPAPPPPSNEEATIDRIRKSGLGWFEGGTFEENAYLTGNLGFGLERYLSSRWCLFVQPTYQHSLQYFRVGLGPNADRINSLSVLFGAKVRLK